MDTSNLTLYEHFKDTASQYPFKPAIFYKGTKISYSKMVRLIDRRAAVFQNTLGVKEGDVVLVAQPNIPDVMICFFALNKIGAVANLVHPLTPFNQVQSIAKKTNSKYLVLFEQRVAKEVEKYRPLSDKIYVTKVEDFLPPLKHFIYHTFMNRNIRKTLGRFRGSFAGFSYISDLKTRDLQVKLSPFNKEKLTVLLHSGSTTGEPKTICLGDRQFTMSSEIFEPLFEIQNKNCVGQGMLAALPSFHGFGLCTAMYYPLTHGAMCCLYPKFEPKEIAKDMPKTHLRYMVGVPVIFKKLIEEPTFRNSKYLSNITNCYCGGDALDPKVIEEFDSLCERKGGHGHLRVGYGLTETLAVSLVNHPTRFKKGSLGCAIDGMECKILDENENEVPNGEIGEISFKGDGVMLRYYNDEEATKACFSKDGWLKSGDLGYKDDEGYVFFKSRKKRVVKVSGVAVFPSEVENLIDKIPEVSGCAVIRIPNDKMGSSLKAIVVADYFDEEGMKEKILDTCRKYLIRWSVPTEIEFRKELPLTPYNKVNFRLLQDEEDKKRGITN